jgi:hypothetical protein
MASHITSSDSEYLVVDSPYEVANWRPLVQWLLFIPHAILLNAMRTLAGVVFVIYWVMLLVTGRLHKGLYGVMVMHERYSQRATGFFVGWSEVYPPFDFDLGVRDNGAYPPIQLNLPEPPEETPRSAAFNFILAIPHYIVIGLIGIAAALVAIIGWFAVLFTGRWPEGMRDFLVRYANYYLRVWTYVAMVNTDYPRFGL